MRSSERLKIDAFRCVSSPAAGLWKTPIGEALTEAATREEAILQARQLAVLHRSSEIPVHDGEGTLRMTLEV